MDTVWMKIGTVGNGKYVVWQSLDDKPLFQLTQDENAPETDGGYPVLDSLLKLKGLAR